MSTEEADKLRINMDLESLKSVVDEFEIDENSGLWDYIYETFIKEKEARSFVKFLRGKVNKNSDLNRISKKDCEEHFMYLCGAYDEENPNTDSEE